MEKHKRLLVFFCCIFAVLLMPFSTGSAAPLPGGTLDPLKIPKYVTPLVIPPVMKTTGGANTYDIAVRQFQQQILPGGIWNTLNGRTDAFPATRVWSYGPWIDTTPAVAPSAASQFNYPSYTIETTSGTAVNVRWRNELVANPDACKNSPTPATDPNCNFIPHLLPVDQTLHWANPPATGCVDGTDHTDCATFNPAPYTGPVPMVVHVHGAHVGPESDGYAEAWWLPAASNIPAGYSMKGSFFDDITGTNPGNLGYADFSYPNDGPASTVWYHDHALGMTRLNVYAGPAGFWVIRGGANELATGLPKPAPVSGEGVVQVNFPGALGGQREKYREIPIAIQDRSFNIDGSLFYPASRLFFDGYVGPYVPTSDIAPIWNPEAFFNHIVVNGVTWPVMEVAPALYRFRLLNGCNSRFLNLALFQVVKETVVIRKGANAGQIQQVTKYGAEIPFYQIGAEQGFLPQVVMISTGFATTLPGDGTVPAAVAATGGPQQALLMGLAERADVIVDFRNLPTGTRVRMINTAPDAPFGGFPDVPADPSTTGQIMEFVVNANPAAPAPGLPAGPLGASPTDPVLADGVTPNPNAAVDPTLLALPAEAALGAPDNLRDVSLNEELSGQVCVRITPSGNITVIQVFPPPPLTEPQIITACAAFNAVPMGPKAAKVGIVDQTNPAAPLGIPLAWHDTTGASTMVDVTMQNGTVKTVHVTENPLLNTTEQWDIYNFTVDAHPIHLHLVRFQVVGRQPIPGVVPAPVPVGLQPWETGYKDTVIAYPGEITSVKALFDTPGLYVWHCHIVEHEDNEMMRPFVVSP